MTHASAEAVRVPSRRSRVVRIRLQVRRFSRASSSVLHRAENLADELLDRAREKRRGTAPAPDPNSPRPGSDDWAAWADKNLSAQDAAIFHRPAEADSARSEFV